MGFLEEELADGGTSNLSRPASRGTSEDARHSILVIPTPNAAEESTSPRNFVAPALSTAREWNSQSQSSGLHEGRARTPATPFLSFRRRTRRRNLPLPGTPLPPRSQQRANGIPNLSRSASRGKARTRPPPHSCHSEAERGGGIYLSPELRCPLALSKAREWNSIVSARCDRK